MSFPTDKKYHDSFVQFPSKGILKTGTQYFSYPRETLGKCGVSMWFPYCLTWKTRLTCLYPYIFIWETRISLWFSLKYLCGNLRFPWSFPLSLHCGNHKHVHQSVKCFSTRETRWENGWNSMEICRKLVFFFLYGFPYVSLMGNLFLTQWIIMCLTIIVYKHGEPLTQGFWNLKFLYN